MRFNSLIIAALIGALSAFGAEASPWRIDKPHAHVTFSVDNLGFSITQGRFKKFDAEIDFDPENVEATQVTFTIQTKSIDTLSKSRDKHLRSKAFLYVKEFPEIRFVSSSVRLVDETHAEVKGDLTIRGVTREHTFDAELKRIGPNPFNADMLLAGFVVTGDILRTDFDVSYGAPAIGVSVPIRVDLQIVPKQ